MKQIKVGSRVTLPDGRVGEVVTVQANGFFVRLSSPVGPYERWVGVE